MRTPTLAVALSFLSLLPVAAQEAPPPEPTPAPRPSPRPVPLPVPLPAPQPRRSVEPLKVQVTVSRFEGDKKVSSLPNTLLVNANQDRTWTKLRMGFEVPVRVGTTDKESKTPVATHQYRNVGINIDCRAYTMDDGRYALEGTVEQSSLYTPAERTGTGLPDLPLFRTFSSAINATLRDGQSATIVAATDPVSGETVRIDVSLNVIR